MTFLKKQEVDVTFTKIANIDSWNASIETSQTMKAIVAESGGVINPAVATERNDSIRIFVKNMPTLEIAEGDIVKFRNSDYQITSIDGRGVLPGKYPNRIEARRSVK